MKKELQIMAWSRTTTGKKCFKAGLILAAALLLMTAGQARADVIFSLVGVTPNSPTDFTYTYNVILTGGSTLHRPGGGDNTGFSPSNNFITLFDVPGLISGSESYSATLAPNVTPPGAVEKAIGDVAPRTTPTDTSILNINTYWVGGDVSAPPLIDLTL